MKSAWQITLLGLVVVFPAWAWDQAGERARFQSPQSETTLVAPMPPDANPSRRWMGEWWLGSAVQNFSEGKDEGTGNVVKVGMLFRYEMAPWARFLIEGDARFYASRVQARYDDGVMESGPKLRNGYFSFGVDGDTGFEFRMGALSQRELRSDLLISGRRAFPGLREGVAIGNSKVRLAAFAQQALPTSYSLNTERSEREKTPTFLTETLNVKITPAKVFEAEFYATHFRFNNLPAVVAFESSALGNTVNGEVAPNSEFKYGFDGYLLGVEACLCRIGPLGFRAGGQWLQNTSAPMSANRGQLLFLEGQLRLQDVLDIKPRFSAFFNESDTSPAYYNRWDIGNNNRKGIIAELDFEFPRYGFTVEIDYVQASLINEDPFQFDKQVFTLGVETNHVPF